MSRLIAFVLVFLSVTFAIAEEPAIPEGVEPSAQLAYADDIGEIYVISFWDNGAILFELITGEFKGWAGDPEWSEDGQKLAFIGQDRLDTDVYIWDGEITKVTDTKDRKTYLQWSPDGTRIIYTQIRSYIEEPQLIMLDLRSDEVTVLAEGVPGCCLLWLDDQRLAFISLTHGEVVLDLLQPTLVLPYDGDSLDPGRYQQLPITSDDTANGGYILDKDTQGYFHYSIIGWYNGTSIIQQWLLKISDRRRGGLIDLQGIRADQADWRPRPATN